MCLSVPAKLITIYPEEKDPLLQQGKVSFNGVTKDVSLAYVPNAKIDDYVLIHAGFAISIIDAQEAEFIYHYLQQEDEAPKN